jgi:hypothetical protein
MNTSAPLQKSVTVDNFIRAESDLYFRAVVGQGGFGKFEHHREPQDIANQTVIRLNRDTLYSAALFDLNAGPAVITLPDSGKRFMSMMVVNEDHFVTDVFYGAGTHTLTREDIGTRYVLVGIRTLVDPQDPHDLKQVHALQDAITSSQAGTGTFEVPAWDAASQKKVREALLTLGETLPDLSHAFGKSGEVDPVRHLIASASAWGGNPDKEATYLNFTPSQNDGLTVYRLTVRDVPVDGFWSISVYNAEGYYEPNSQNAYSINNLTAKKDADGGVTIQFGGDPASAPNFIATMSGWNYLVRLYRPRAAVLDGTWTFPEATVA